jgi:hypothetical protein
VNESAERSFEGEGGKHGGMVGKEASGKKEGRKDYMKEGRKDYMKEGLYEGRTT